MEQILFPDIEGKLRCHQAAEGGNYRSRLSLQNPAQRLNALLRKLVSMNIRLIENKIPRRINDGLPVIKPLIL